MPTTIGSLSNVPNPGSPITSPWAQDVTRLARHAFTNAASLLAQWPTAANGAHAVLLDTNQRVERRGGVWVYVDPVVGTHTDSLTAVAAKAFTVAFGVTFTAAPVVTVSVVAGASADLVFNWTAAPGTTSGPGRVAVNSGSPVSASFAILWVAHGTRAVV